MKNIKKYLLMSCVLAIFSTSLWACGEGNDETTRDTATTESAKRDDSIAEDVGDAAGDVIDGVGDGAEDVIDGVGKGVKNVTDGVSDGIDEITDDDNSSKKNTKKSN